MDSDCSSGLRCENPSMTQGLCTSMPTGPQVRLDGGVDAARPVDTAAPAPDAPPPAPDAARDVGLDTTRDVIVDVTADVTAG